MSSRKHIEGCVCPYCDPDYEKRKTSKKSNNFDWWEIDKNMGESRAAQVAGAILMILLIGGSLIYAIIR
jgi:hypothetical protein